MPRPNSRTNSKITPKQADRMYEDIIRQEDRQQLDRRLKRNFPAVDSMRLLQQASEDQGRKLELASGYLMQILDQEFYDVVKASNTFFEEYAETETPRAAIWPVFANVGTQEHEDWQPIGWTPR